jgi:hypothetical protein
MVLEDLKLSDCQRNVQECPSSFNLSGAKNLANHVFLFAINQSQLFAQSDFMLNLA